MDQSFFVPVTDTHLLLYRLQKRYGTEELARESFVRLLRRDHFRCRKCSFQGYRYLQARDLVECTRCKTQHSATSGTPMHGIRKGLSAWALFLLFYSNPSLKRDLPKAKEYLKLSDSQYRRWKAKLQNPTRELNHLIRAFLADLYRRGYDE